MTLNIWFDTKFEKRCGGDNRAKIANAAWANHDSQDRYQMNPESLAAQSLGMEDFMKKATAKDKVIHKAWKMRQFSLCYLQAHSLRKRVPSKTSFCVSRETIPSRLLLPPRRESNAQWARRTKLGVMSFG